MCSEASSKADLQKSVTERTLDFGVVRIRGSPLAAFRSLSDHCISKGAIILLWVSFRAATTY